MRVEESYPGEFEGLTHDELEERIHKAVLLTAGHPRGGELQLMLDLGGELSEKYRERTNAMLADFAELEEAGELEPFDDQPADWMHHVHIPEVDAALSPEELQKAFDVEEDDKWWLGEDAL